MSGLDEQTDKKYKRYCFFSLSKREIEDILGRKITYNNIEYLQRKLPSTISEILFGAGLSDILEAWLVE